MRDVCTLYCGNDDIPYFERLLLLLLLLRAVAIVAIAAAAAHTHRMSGRTAVYQLYMAGKWCMCRVSKSDTRNHNSKLSVQLKVFVLWRHAWSMHSARI